MKIQSVYCISKLRNDPLRMVGNLVQRGMKDNQELLKDKKRRQTRRKEKKKKTRVKNSMASKEYCKENHHLVLARSISKVV